MKWVRLIKTAENRPSEALDTADDECEDELDEVDQNDDWEEGVAMLESKWTAETVDEFIC